MVIVGLMALVLFAVVVNGLVAEVEDRLPASSDPAAGAPSRGVRRIGAIGRWAACAVLLLVAALGLGDLWAERSAGGQMFAAGCAGGAMLLGIAAVRRSRTLLWVAACSVALGLAAALILGIGRDVA